jgi:hypothetical protein
MSGRAIATGCGTVDAAVNVAAVPIDDAVMDTATTASITRRRTGSVINREPFSKRRLPLSTATAYTTVLTRSHPDTTTPKRRSSEVNAVSGLAELSHECRWENGTVPNREPDSTKNTSSTISEIRTPVASR